MTASMKRALKSVGRILAPDMTLALLSIRSRRMIEAQCRDLGLHDLAGRIARRSDAGVHHGPFAGVALDIDALPVHSAPKLCGTYEDELHEAVEEAIARQPRTIVNVGAAEGYYAVGLALRLLDAPVHAHDADPKALKAVRRNAALNGVSERVHTGGILHGADLDRLVGGGRTLVVMDIEGGEADLLDPARARSLLRADILVELHPAAVPGIEALIRDRFSRSHDMRIIEARPTDAKLKYAPDWLPAAGRRRAVDERRGPQSWMWLRRRADA